LLEENKVARLIAEACLEEKAGDVLILDVGHLTIIADYFVIASGRSVIQVRSIAENVEKKLKEHGIIPLRRDGHNQGTWIVMDFGSVLVHIFRQEERDYYQLENLWGDAREVALEGSPQ